MESPFAVTSRIISEVTPFADSLEIIASDAKGLAPQDRAILRDSAAELRHLYRAIAASAAEAEELKAKLRAAQDRIAALAPPPPAPAAGLGLMGTHWSGVMQANPHWSGK